MGGGGLWEKVCSEEKSVTVVFARVVSYLTDSAHTHILTSRVARCPVHHSLPVAVEEVLALWHAVQLAWVLGCGQRALSQISRSTSTFCTNRTSGEKPTVTSDLHSMATTCRVSPGSWRRQSWSTAPHGSPWNPQDSPGPSQQGEKVSKDRQTFKTTYNLEPPYSPGYCRSCRTFLDPHSCDLHRSWGKKIRQQFNWANYGIKHWHD